MSICSQRLLRSRLIAGLPPARTLRALGTGYLHHYWRIHPGQRHIANDASNTEILRDSGSTGSSTGSSSYRFDVAASELNSAVASPKDSFDDALLYEGWAQVLEGVAEPSAEEAERKPDSRATNALRRRRVARASTSLRTGPNRSARDLDVRLQRGNRTIASRSGRYSFHLANARRLIQDLGGPTECASALNRHLYLARSRLHFLKKISPWTVRFEAAQFLRVLYRGDKFMIRWNNFYKQQFKHRQKRKPFNDLDPPMLGDMDPDARRLANLLETGNRECFQQAWRDSSRNDKIRNWQRMAKYFLQNRLEYLLDFLLLTTTSAKDTELPNFNMVADCFTYYERFYARRLQRNGPEWEAYRSAVEVCLRPETWPSLSARQMGMRLFILRANPEAVVRAFRLTWLHRVHMRAQTLLCFVKRLGEIGEIDRALGALRMVSAVRQPGYGLSSEVVMRHCCKLLTHDTVVDVEGTRNFRILPRLLHMGVQPDRDMMNVVLANALKTGDRELAFDMLQYMKDQGFELDSFTYLALLTYAVAVEDRDYAVTLLQEIEAREDLVRDPFLSSKAFHAHYIFTVKRADRNENPAEVFYSMLEYYMNHYDIAPLKELWILPPHFSPATATQEQKPPPSVVSLYIMIATFLRCNRPAQKIIDVYQQFRTLLGEGNKLIWQLARTDHVYNEFLCAFRTHPRTLMNCVRVVDDLRNGPPRGSEAAANPQLASRHAKPSTLTWNILLSAFVYHRKALSVAKIKEMMAREGVPYNEATWNMVVNDFANRQLIPQIADSIRAMEEQGFEMNPYVIKSLGYVQDTKRLWTAIDALGKKPAEAPSRASSPRSRSDSNQTELEVAGESATPQPSGPPSGEAEHSPTPDQEHDALLESGLRRLRRLKSAEETQV